MSLRVRQPEAIPAYKEIAHRTAYGASVAREKRSLATTWKVQNGNRRNNLRHHPRGIP